MDGLDDLESILNDKLAEATEAIVKGMPQTFEQYRFMVGTRAGIEHALVELKDLRKSLMEKE